MLDRENRSGENEEDDLCVEVDKKLNNSESKGTGMECKDCNKVYHNRSNLARHRKRFHSNEPPIYKAKDCQHKCDQCNRQYSSMHNLNYHLRQVHGRMLDNHLYKKRECPLCLYVGAKSRNDIIDHFRSAHKIEAPVKTCEFGDYSAFEKWKRGLEKRSKQRFVKSYSGRELKYFVCCRSGFFVTEGQGIRKLKKSIKINGYCPARVYIKCKKDGSVSAEYVDTHVGHSDCDQSSENETDDEEQRETSSVAPITVNEEEGADKLPESDHNMLMAKKEELAGKLEGILSVVNSSESMDELNALMELLEPVANFADSVIAKRYKCSAQPNQAVVLIVPEIGAKEDPSDVILLPGESFPETHLITLDSGSVIDDSIKLPDISKDLLIVIPGEGNCSGRDVRD